MTVTNHPLPEAAFTELAEGGGGPAAMWRLGEAQRSKHMMLLHAIAEAATGSETGPVAFRAGYEQLARIQDTAPGAADWLLGLPHLGGWVHDTLIHLDQGTAADFGHFACLVAAAAIRAGLAVDLDVPVRDGRVRLPGLGSLLVASERSWIRLSGDGERVTAGDEFAVEARWLAPDDGTGAPDRHRAVWSGTPAIRATGGGLTWTVLLETGDPYLDRYTLPMRTAMSAARGGGLAPAGASAWQIWWAAPLGRGADGGDDLGHRPADTALRYRSGQRDHAGRLRRHRDVLAAGWVTLAETLVHEFQHVKLCGLLDLVPLAEPGEHACTPRGVRTRGPQAACCRASTLTWGSPASGRRSSTRRPSRRHAAGAGAFRPLAAGHRPGGADAAGRPAA